MRISNHNNLVTNNAIAAQRSAAPKQEQTEVNADGYAGSAQTESTEEFKPMSFSQLATDPTTSATKNRASGLFKTGLAVAAGVGALGLMAAPAFAASGDAAVEAVAETAGAAAESAGGSWLKSALPLAFLAIPVGFMAWQAFKNGGIGGIGGDSGMVSTDSFDWVDNVDKRFSDVAGIPVAKQELMEMVNFLTDPERFTKLGAKVPKGALLQGPPGTGKTLLAEAVAGEAGLPFVKVDGSEFVEKYVGVGASRVRSLFAQARQKAAKEGGAIIFIDEIDAIGRARNGESNNRESENTLNQLLTEISGFENDENIIVLAASNRPELLDKALTRSGRLSRKVVVDAPGREGREAILKIHARNKPVAKDVDFSLVAARTPGLVGADMMAIMNEAAIYAARDKADEIGMDHISSAIDKVIMGEQRSGTVLTPKERIATAYHEGGHAIIARALPSNGSLHKVTILPRGQALGVTWAAPDTDKHGYSKEDLEDKICMLMGGRAAEEVCFDEIYTGPSNDFMRATQLANRMVSEFGMDEEVGTVTINPKQTGWTPSGELGNKASTAVKNILDAQYNRAKEILVANRAPLDDISEAMLDVEELDKPEIDAILGDRVPVLREDKDLNPYRPGNEKHTGGNTGEQ